MQGLVIINVSLVWIVFKTKSFHFDFKVMFPYWFQYVSYYHDTVCYKKTSEIK